MRPLYFAAAAASALTLMTAGEASAERGSNGGDREPAGGAFNSSYLAPGTTGIQDGGPPRSVDIPRRPYRAYGYQSRDPDETGSIGYGSARRRYR